ncbi:MAG: [protein-PII] uridylyltransferase [Hyphomonadaceae bacterium]|nr:MAG: protein-PII uridylyltransferase [Caulobacteraceae bacterium]MBT9444450.1 [protein-PII] uridylyltransferase [Hyphomonadaceae bacterium]TPW03713.1 MAG: protein-PII uridylyltransferase [Alphaproteobacteria bacterium]
MPQRLPPARIEDVVDGVKLRSQLTAAALGHIGEESAARARALDLLHGALFRGRMIAKDRLGDGAGGHETAALLCQVADEVITALYDFTTTHVFRARNPTEGERFAVVAVGGYGRGQMAPSSDIDLLFLRSYKETPWSESVTEFMLYMLWDMSLKVGHASRTLDECMRLAREDHTVQTALLEARFLAGDRELFDTFVVRYRKEVLDPGHRAFVAAKLKERDERHTRAGASRYLVEPNIKEGKGGLRDLHTLFWIQRHRHGWVDPFAYMPTGIFTREEIALGMRASEFFWRVRCHLHFLTGRPEERLTFDVQPELARRLGFGERNGVPAVERFMKRYFLAAKDVGTLTRIMSAKLEADDAKKKPTGLSRFISNGMSRPRVAADGFRVESGRLTAETPQIFDNDPVNLLRIFRVADARDLDLHPDALAEITRRLKRITPAVREDPDAQLLFLQIAASPNSPAATLRLMNEAGVLGRFLPEFGRIVAQMQFNMYHHYTVDEHTLRAVEVISDIEKGRCATEHPLATAIFPKIVNRRALYMAMLLHDTGKGIGDQQEEGEKTAMAACARLGMPREEVELVGWLVRHHLLMSDVAQKRDIGDPRTVASFAEIVGTLERLRLLLVLTIADIRAVGPGVWNGWKGQLLRDLYRLAEAAFHGGRTDEVGVRERLADQAFEIKTELVATMKPVPRLVQWLDTLDDAYWLSFDREALRWHVEAASTFLSAGGEADGVHVVARAMPNRGVTELLVHAQDRPGLFASLAASLAAGGADVSDARVHTTRDGQAFDVFSLLDAEGAPFGASDPHVLQRLVTRVKAAAGGAPQATLARRPVQRRAAAFAIEPWARIDNDLSREATVVEVSGRDRPGLLAALAQVLADAKVSITSAHIDAYGERVADVFYVTEHDGAQVTDPARIALLQTRLTDALRENEPDAPADPARRSLAVAPASTGR